MERIKIFGGKNSPPEERKAKDRHNIAQIIKQNFKL